MAAKAFEVEFQRPGTITKLRELLNLAERKSTFARVASIVQSSGWGKSRSICELWREGVWVFYCSLGQGTGYPRRSSIADWLLAEVDALISAQREDQLKCMAFFLAYFEACLGELLDCVDSDPSLTPRQFVKMLYKSGDTDEDREGNTECADAGIRFWDNVKQRMEDLRQRYDADGLCMSQGRTRGECWKRWERRAAVRMQPVAKLAKSKFRVPVSRRGGVQIVFVFDEARILVPEVLDKNIYLPLRRATSAFKQGSGILTLFADTASRIANFAAPIWMEPSDRMPGTNLRLATPIWACFWADHGIEEWSSVCARHGIPERDVLSDYWPLRYGRPMWWYMFKELLDANNDEEVAVDEVMTLACDKLLGGSGGYARHVDGPTLLTSEMAIAVVGSRCALGIDPRCSAVSTLVARNLMTVVKVDAKRECLFADWPMEPILSQAAAKIMHELDVQGRNRELYLPLAIALKEGWVALGELLTRLILLRAIDKARSRTDQSWCTLDQFVEQLVGRSLLKLVPAADQTDEFKELASSKLCFTSFHKIHKKSYDLTEQDLQAAAERRSAIVTEDGMWGVDHIMTDEVGEVKLHNQVKLRKSDSPIADLAKESPPFCGVQSKGMFMSLHMNVLKSSDKVTVVDPYQVEQAVRENKPNKVVEAVLEWEAEEKVEPSKRQRLWETRKAKNPRLFQAWQSWFGMPRKNQFILKVHGFGAFKNLLGQELLALLQNIAENSGSWTPSDDFESLQVDSVNNMFPVKCLVG